MDSKKERVKRDGYLQGDVFERGESPMETTAIFPRSASPENSYAIEKMFCTIGKDPEKPEYRCYPYKKSPFRHFLMILVYIFSAGFMWLMFYWRPDWKLKFTHYLASFSNCTSVFLEDLDGTHRVYVSEIKVTEASVKKWAPYLFSKSPTMWGMCNEQQDVTFRNDKFVDEESGSMEFDNRGPVKYFVHHLSKYIWDEALQNFVKVEGYDGNMTLDDVHKSADSPISKANAEAMCDLFGENVIHVKIPSYFSLLVAEVLNPFYVFQLAACLFWMADEYYAYATAILVISFISAVVSLITIRKERVALHDMVERHNTARISVVRDIKARQDFNAPSSSNGVPTAKDYVMEDIWIKDLVPGDVVVIPSSGVQLSFDAALISGSCIVNESMLTGESVPVTKTPLPSGESELVQNFKVDQQKAHMLFCGTEVVQTRFYQDEVVRAVVVRTGYGTAKGQLVHSILFPKPVNLELLRDAYRFVGVMCLISLVGFAYSAYTLVQHGETARDIAFKSIDVITITVPPALPLAMTIGIIYAQDRLKKAFIRTISPQRINICGQVDVVAFDKTGTLTEEGLDLSHVLPVSSAKFDSPLKADRLKMQDKKSDLLRCMATCHSLTVIDGETSGDPLDLKMFEATGFELVEPKVDETTNYDQLQTTYVRPAASYDETNPGLEDAANSGTDYEVGIIRQFPFLSSLQRASVIAKPLQSGHSDMSVYVKGAPETIARLCLPDTVPCDFKDVLKAHTKEGYRVIALSFKNVELKWLKAQKIERDLVEKDLAFLGFLILQNKLKPTSAGVIRELDEATIRTVMVTGDNLETAICVGRECRILKPGKVLLGVTSDLSGTYPVLRWRRVEEERSPKKKSLSSSDELSETVIAMGDALAPGDCQIAVSGTEFAVVREYFPQFVKAMAVQGAIFARMSPGQKTQLMEELEGVGYHTLMCGDGANDCGALKRAHVGLSLSELEASVAAPFTANIENGIGSVVTLMREGRAALVTSFGMFKFMALYSMIQFTTILLLYRNNTILSDYQFLYIDLIVIDFIAITMSRNHSYKTLHRKKPSSSLVSLEMLVSLLLQIFLQMGLQVYAYIIVQRQCWYRDPILVNTTTGEIINEDHGTAFEINSTGGPIATTSNSVSCPSLSKADNVTSYEEDTPKTYETTTLLYVSTFMYMSVSVAFSHGKPFRTAIYKNRWFLGSLVVLIAFTLFMMFGAPLEFNEFMELWRIPDIDFLFVLCAIVVVHFLLSLLIERIFIENPGMWQRIKAACSRGNKIHKKQYKNIEEYLSGGHKNGLANGTYSSVSDVAVPSHYDGREVFSKIPVQTQKSDGKILTEL